MRILYHTNHPIDKAIDRMTLNFKNWLMVKIKGLGYSVFPFLFPEHRKVWPLYKKGTYSVYGLLDPTTAEIFYIGLSRNVQKRFNRHINKALNGEHGNADVMRRIRDLVEIKAHPFLIIFYTGLNAYDASRVEIMTIARFKEGHDLYNKTRGGELGQINSNHQNTGEGS